MKQLMMIGFGAMAAEVYAHMPQDLQLKWIVVPARSVEKVQAQVSAQVQVISSIDQCLGNWCTQLCRVPCQGYATARCHRH